MRLRTRPFIVLAVATGLYSHVTSVLAQYQL